MTEYNDCGYTPISLSAQVTLGAAEQMKCVVVGLNKIYFLYNNSLTT